MLENEFHKLEEKQEIRTTISQIRKEIKKQDSKKAFLELLQGKESMIVDFLSEEDAKAMIVRGFAYPISKELPVEYAVEMNNLINLELQGAIG